jgi:hypothetical protein
VLSRLQQLQGRFDDPALPLAITGQAQRPAHQIGRSHQARRGHGLKTGLKGADGHNHRSDAGFLKYSAQVSHGHMTDRSDGHQQRSVDLFLPKDVNPLRRDPCNQRRLRAGANKRIGGWRQIADGTLTL